MASDSPTTIAVVAAYGRNEQLRDLLASLRDAGRLRKVIVVDNGMDARAEAVCRCAPVPVLYHRPERNLGCGGGVGRGLSLGLKEEGVTEFCLFDDDAAATPGAIETLVRGMRRAEADLAVPLVVNAAGQVSWFPGLRQPLAWETIRRGGLTPAEYLRICGPEPVPFTWAPWPAIALSARVARECGVPRDDFWLCGEDLEYTLRLTYRHRGALVPEAVCRHLPPPSSGGDELEGPHYLRFCLLLQNLSYICTRLPHARRALRHLPGNYLRFFRVFGWNAATLTDASLALWRGVVRGHPAGVPGCDQLRRRFLAMIERGGR